MQFLSIAIFVIWVISSVAEYAKKHMEDDEFVSEEFDLFFEDEEIDITHIDDEISTDADAAEIDIGIESVSGLEVDMAFEEIDNVQISHPIVAEDIKSRAKLSRKQLKKLIVYKEILDKPKALK